MSPANVSATENVVAEVDVATASRYCWLSVKPEPFAQVGIFRAKLIGQGFAEPFILFFKLNKIRHLIHCRNRRLSRWVGLLWRPLTSGTLDGVLPRDLASDLRLTRRQRRFPGLFATLPSAPR